MAEVEKNPEADYSGLDICRVFSLRATFCSGVAYKQDDCSFGC